MAIQDYDEVIRLIPGYADAYNNRGITYRDLGQIERAISDCGEAIRLNRQYALAYVNRALAYTTLGRDSEAQQDVKRAVELGRDQGTLDAAIEELIKQR